MGRFHPVLRRAAVAGGAIAAWYGIAGVLFPQDLLTVDSGKVKADVLVVLGGRSEERVKHATELFTTGAAPKILVTGTGDCEANAALLEKSGVPASVIVEENRSSSTFENAEFSVPLLRQMGARRVILVTTWYHSRRALACFEHFAPDIIFYSRPSYFAYRRKIWNRQNMGNAVQAELVKLPGYWIWYGVRPYPL